MLMSNHECCADVYQLGSRLYLRCFKDGRVGDITDWTRMRKTCPMCKRPLDAKFHNKDPKTRTSVEVRLKISGRWTWVHHETYEEDR